MNTDRIRFFCAQIEKARAMGSISVAERHEGGNEKKSKIWMVDVDVSIGNCRSFKTQAEAEAWAEKIRAIWCEPLADAEKRAMAALREEAA